MDPTLQALLTVAGTVFVAELTDKDALFLLVLATKTRPQLVFAAGAVAFTISTAVILTVGSFVLAFVPVFWVKLGGGVIMIGYAFWDFREKPAEEEQAEAEEEKILKGKGRSDASVFFPAVLWLITLDLAGDATEVLSVVLLAHFRDIVLVFLGCVAALVSASAVETMLGNRLSKVLSLRRIRYLSLVVLLAIGSSLILFTLFPLP